VWNKKEKLGYQEKRKQKSAANFNITFFEDFLAEGYFGAT